MAYSDQDVFVKDRCWVGKRGQSAMYPSLHTSAQRPAISDAQGATLCAQALALRAQIDAHHVNITTAIAVVRAAIDTLPPGSSLAIVRPRIAQPAFWLHTGRRAILVIDFYAIHARTQSAMLLGHHLLIAATEASAIPAICAPFEGSAWRGPDFRWERRFRDLLLAPVTAPPRAQPPRSTSDFNFL